MSEKKRCPLKMLAGFVGDFQNCSEGKCAWYDSNWRECAILALAKSVNALAGA